MDAFVKISKLSAARCTEHFLNSTENGMVEKAEIFAS